METLFILNKEISKFDDIIIYGAGNAGRVVLMKLLQNNIGAYCFADSDPEKCGKRVLNIPVRHIDELAEMKSRAAVIVAGFYALEVAKELEKRGFKNIFCDLTPELYALHLEREEF